MKVMVIDGNSILNRAFYGIRLLTNHEGLYTNAIYGFLSTLFKLQDEELPDRTVVCFDVREKTFRHKRFDTYKATRKGMPDELAMQLPVMKDVLNKLGIACCELPGYEADDLIGTISRILNEHGDECVIVTGDRDSLQLVGGGTTVRLVATRMGQTTTTKYDETLFREEYGFAPQQLIDLKALMGDSSDNISGVPGVGQKTAMTLLLEFGTLDEIYRHLDSPSIKKGVREKLTKGEQSAHDSYWLATIDRNAPLPLDPTTLPDEFIDEEGLYALLNRLEFKNFIKRLGLTADSGLPDSVEEEQTTEIVRITDTEAGFSRIRQAAEGTSTALYLTTRHDAFCLLGSQDAAVFLEQDFSEDEWYELLRRLFSGAVSLIMHDAKEHLVWLMGRGIQPEGIVFDTCLGAYLLNPAEGAYDLQRISLAYLSTELPDAVFEQEDAFAPLGNATESIKQLVHWTETVRRLEKELSARLEELPKLKSLYYDLELPLMTVLADMQHIGCKADPKLLHEFGEQLDSRIAELVTAIYSTAGGEFNINSPKQLGEVLFERLGLPALKKTKSGYSTNAEVLEAISGYHPVVGQVLEYRQLTKLKSTYVDGLLKVIDPVDGRIHSHFQQTVTATGRLSSTDPNLQNIPVRTELGRELRRMFLAEDTQHILIDADYSQIELRVLAHVAQDQAMLEAFRAGQDIHTATAAKVYGVPPEDVTPQMRTSCKAVNFGIVYGISDFSLSADLGITRKQAGAFIRNYLATYPGVEQYMQEIKEFAREHGYVETLFGRRRYLPELKSKSFAIRSFGERAAMNTPIQGTAADIIKIAMLRVWRRLRAEGFQSRLILQVHDELILEAPIEEQEAVTRLLTEEMEGAFQMDAPLVAEAHIGHDWYTAKG